MAIRYTFHTGCPEYLLKQLALCLNKNAGNRMCFQLPLHGDDDDDGDRDDDDGDEQAVTRDTVWIRCKLLKPSNHTRYKLTSRTDGLSMKPGGPPQAKSFHLNGELFNPASQAIDMIGRLTKKHRQTEDVSFLLRVKCTISQRRCGADTLTLVSARTRPSFARSTSPQHTDSGPAVMPSTDVGSASFSSTEQAPPPPALPSTTAPPAKGSSARSCPKPKKMPRMKRERSDSDDDLNNSSCGGCQLCKRTGASDHVQAGAASPQDATPKCIFFLSDFEPSRWVDAMDDLCAL